MKHDNDNIKHQYEEFFANGGTITKCPSGKARGLYEQTLRAKPRQGKNGHEKGVTLGNKIHIFSAGIGNGGNRTNR